MWSGISRWWDKHINHVYVSVGTHNAASLMTCELVWSYAEQSGFKLGSLNHYKTSLLATGESFCQQAHITRLATAHNCLTRVYRLDQGSFDPEW
jgi:hypothetical protein